VERMFFADEDFSEQLMAVEDALIDSYILCELSPAEHERFHRLVQSNAKLHEKVEFTRRLIQNVGGNKSGNTDSNSPNISEASVPKRNLEKRTKHYSKFLPYAAAFLLAATLTMLFQEWRFRRNVENLEAARATLLQQQQELQREIAREADEKQALLQELQTEREKSAEFERQIAEQNRSEIIPSLTEFASILLTPAISTRSEGLTKTVKISPAQRQLKLRLEFDNSVDYEKYEAVIRPVGGRTVWSGTIQSPKQPDATTLVFIVPLQRLPAGDYLLTLRGYKGSSDPVDIDDYQFRITR
jgi:hypothetical protein